MSHTISVDVDVDLDDFDEDDIVEYLEDCGYTVSKDVEKLVNKFERNDCGFSYDSMENCAERIKEIFHSHYYESRFVRHILTSIADMPICSDLDSVMAKLKQMCE